MNNPEKAQISVQVTQIVDGKTFKGKRAKTTAEEQFHLENVTPPEKGELGYENAKKALADLIEGKEVLLEETEEGKVKVTIKEVTKENQTITLDINALMQKQDKRRYK